MYPQSQNHTALIVRRADGNRKIMIDATLEGMGKCAGNLNTELLIDYLNRMENGDYDTITPFFYNPKTFP